MHFGHVIPSERRPLFYRWSWLVVLIAVTVTALVFVWLGAERPQVVVYPTTDFARLPISASTTPAVPTSCVAVQQINGSPKLVDEACGSPASTFRVIGRVGNASQCVHDADLTYSSPSGAVCLDYDWVADQCLQIANDAVSKVNCADRGAVRPEMAIIGALDVSYCREGGIAHSVRHFTICTLAGNKNCTGRANGT